MITNETTQMTEAQTMVLTRTFNAPLSHVWKAWTESECVKQWWGPQGFHCPVAMMDVREGGTSLVCMRTNGFDIYNTWTYSKILPQGLLEYVLRFSDQDGNPLDPAAIGLPPGIPKEVPHQVTFKSVGNKTVVTVTESGYSSEQVAEISKAGMSQCLDKMDVLLSSLNQNN